MSAPRPFAFLGCVELQELLPFQARDERELLETLPRVSDESIFSHTAGVLLRRAVLPEAYPNDFALWVGAQVGDRRLAERLAMVDIFDTGSAEAVRAALIATVEEHLSHFGVPPAVTEGEPFHFIQSHVVPVPTGHRVATLAEFQDALAEVDASAVFYHVVEARYRLGRGRSDFAEWIDLSLGQPELADRISRIDPYVGSLERLRERHLAIVGRAMEEGGA